MDIKTAVEVAGPCRKKINIEIPAAEVGKAYQHVLDGFVRHASIPGFRAGKAPKNLVERRFQKTILEELRDYLVPQAYHQALRQEKLNPVSILDLTEPKVDSAAAFAFSAVLDVAPEFELPTYKGLAAKIAPEAVADDRVEEVFKGLRARMANYEEVTGRPAGDDDLVQVDFEGTLDGKPVEEVVPAAKSLGKAAGFWVNIGPEGFLPGFAEGLKGAVIGETREIRSTFEADFSIKEIAGKTIIYKTTVKGLRGRKLPELNEEFFKQVGAKDEAELRTRIRTDLEGAAQAEADRKTRDKIAELLLSAVTMDVPESVVQHETEQIIYDVVRQNVRRGISEQQISEHKQKIFEQASQAAGGRVKLDYILHRIAEQESIAATDADIDERIAAMAARQNTTADEVRKTLEKRHGLDDLREDLKLQKAMDYLVTQAKPA